MLLPNEFVVGSIQSAKSLSLVLPAKMHDETMLVGHIEGRSVAVFLSGDYKSSSFECEKNDYWSGLVVKNVKIELDEKSFVDARHVNVPLLSVIRTGEKLLITAKPMQVFHSRMLITLHENLDNSGVSEVAFSKWRVVIGEGENKRVLWSCCDQ